MVVDEEGFLYPKVNLPDCVNCGLCERVCPQLNQVSDLPEEPVACYAAMSNDKQIRLSSSSGGVFSHLAREILKQGGVVFGARFDDRFVVYHSYTETEAGLSPFLGSKYAQSDLRGAYQEVRRFLKEKRPVLFTGTPCQIAGLRGFLHQAEDENLYLVSVVCHGAPSPRVWSDFLNGISGDNLPTSVTMRNKDDGWSRYRMQIKRADVVLLDARAVETTYMKAFLQDLILRPACYSCAFRCNHGSDLTLGDYWGIEQVHPELSDDLGTSLVLVFSDKGRQLLNRLDIIIQATRYEDVVKGNSAITTPANKPAERVLFWKAYRRRGLAALENFTSKGHTLRKQWARILRRLRIV